MIEKLILGFAGLYLIIVLLFCIFEACWFVKEWIKNG